jgi:hypothetical protein
MKVLLANLLLRRLKLSIDNPTFNYKIHREKVAISSWHINEYESFAMWQIFTQNSEGLAIQSTIGRLQEALAPEINFNQYIGEVNYIDYKKNTFRLTIYFSFSIQTESFQYEGEVRILTDDSTVKSTKV